MIYTLSNIYQASTIDNPVKICREIPGEKWKSYRLLKDVTVALSNSKVITIPKGFLWDLSSVPRIFWAILPPDGDFVIAALIHDYLYQEWKNITWLKDLPNPRKFADTEMLLWSKAMNDNPELGFKNLDNYIDNYLRYYGVRAFGAHAWKN